MSPMMSPAALGQAFFKRADTFAQQLASPGEGAQQQGVTAMMSDRANQAKESARKGLRSKIEGLAGGYGDLRSKIESLSVNFESFDQRLAAVDKDNEQLFSQGQKMQQQLRQKQELEAVANSHGIKAERLEAMLRVGANEYAACAAAFGSEGCRLSEKRVVLADPLLADQAGALVNGAMVKGSIVVIGRGVVPFVEKARRAQESAAVGVIFINTDNRPYVPLGMSGDEDIRLPCVCVTAEAGAAITATLTQYPRSTTGAVSYGDAPLVSAGPEEMVAQFFEGCIRETKMCIASGDLEAAVLHLKRHMQFVEMAGMTDDLAAAMKEEGILIMSEVMKDLEIKVVQALLLEFAEVVAKDDIGPMLRHLERLAQLGHAKQCVGTYSAHLSQIAEIDFEKMESETYVAALERLMQSRLSLLVKHRPIIQLLCTAMAEAGFALELLAEIKAISDRQIEGITLQYSQEQNIVGLHTMGAPWGHAANPDLGMEMVDQRLNEVVVLGQNCVLYTRFFEQEMASLDPDWKRHVRLEVGVAQRVQELAVHYVQLEQQLLEFGIQMAIRNDIRPNINDQQPEAGSGAEPAPVRARP